MSALRSLILPLLALAAATLQAQDYYYRSVMPNGQVVFGDKPAPGANDTQRVPLRAGNTAAPLAPRAPATNAPAAASGPRAVDAAADDVRAAQRELDAARAALEAASEPREGERIGTAGGKSRLNDQYYERIKSQEDRVAAAQKKLDQANAQRNSVR